MTSLENQNAFFDSEPQPGGPPHGQPAASSLSRNLASLRASLAPTPFGSQLRMEPMTVAATRRPWIEASPDRDALNLVIDPTGRQGTGSLRDLTEGRGRTVAGILAAHQIVLDDAELAVLLGRRTTAPITVTRISGPIEAADAVAIERSFNSTVSPLDVELRASASLLFVGGLVELDSRDEDLPLQFVAENLRRYVASLTVSPPGEVAAPDLELVHTILDRTGSFAIRPVETEVFSTAIDVGISTDSNGAPQPADTSLIYDLYANSWHGD